MLEELRQILARNLRRTLTPELAFGIYSALQGKAPESFQYSFPTQEAGEYRFTHERFDGVSQEILPVWHAHWQETEGYRHDQPFNPDLEAYRKSAATGDYQLFLVRYGEQPVGNCGIYLHRSRHTGELIASEDTIFILSEHRKGRLGIEFCRYVEGCLASIGCRELRVTVKTVNRVTKLLMRRGYEHTANVLIKML